MAKRLQGLHSKIGGGTWDARLASGISTAVRNNHRGVQRTFRHYCTERSEPPVDER
jgi:hypothetical protein